MEVVSCSLFYLWGVGVALYLSLYNDRALGWRGKNAEQNSLLDCLSGRQSSGLPQGYSSETWSLCSAPSTEGVEGAASP